MAIQQCNLRRRSFQLSIRQSILQSLFILLKLVSNALQGGSTALTGVPTALLQSSSCRQWRSSSGLNCSECTFEGDYILRNGKPAILPDRILLGGHGTTAAFDSDVSWGCYLDVPPSDLQLPRPPSGAQTTNVTGTREDTIPRSQGPATLDLSSLSGIFVITATGRVAVRGLVITGANLNTTGPLGAESFLALSAFRLSGSNASRTSIGQPRLVLLDLDISTPSCSALLLHQHFACAASPSPNFTITPTALVVHSFTTPITSITNVTLRCSGLPALLPCLARRASTGSELAAAIRAMQADVDTAVLRQVPVTSYLYLQRDMVLVDSGSTSAFPLTVSNMDLVVSGQAGGTTVLDLANTASLISIDTAQAAAVQLRSLTIHNAPLGPTAMGRVSLLRLWLWSFAFGRLLLGPRITVMALRSVTIQLPRVELALWFSNFLGRDHLPSGLRADLCADGGDVLVVGSEVVAAVDRGGCPSLLLKQMQTWSGAMVFQDTLLTADDSTWCDRASYVGGSGAAISNSTQPSDSLLAPPGPSPAPAADCPAHDPMRSSQPLCLLVPEGVCGAIPDVGLTVQLTYVSLPVNLASGVERPTRGLYGWVISEEVVARINPPLNSYNTNAPAVLRAPAVLLGSPIQAVVLDVFLLPAAIVFAADNASITMRHAILINLPPAGYYPVAVEAAWAPNSPFPPGTSPPPLPVTRRLLHAPGSSAKAQPAITRRSHLASVLVLTGIRNRERRRRLVDGIEVDVPPGVTQGLTAALTNFTSCLWTVAFNRTAATAAAAGSDDVTSSKRPAGLPYILLDSMVLLVPQLELDFLAWAWVRAATSSAFVADPGLGEQLALMRVGSQLAVDTAAALGTLGQASGPRLNATTRLSFERLWWCGMEGRNVTFTSVLPDLPPSIHTLELQPLQLELPQPPAEPAIPAPNMPALPLRDSTGQAPADPDRPVPPQVPPSPATGTGHGLLPWSVSPPALLAALQPDAPVPLPPLHPAPKLMSEGPSTMPSATPLVSSDNGSSAHAPVSRGRTVSHAAIAGIIVSVGISIAYIIAATALTLMLRQLQPAVSLPLNLRGQTPPRQQDGTLTSDFPVCCSFGDSVEPGGASTGYPCGTGVVTETTSTRLGCSEAGGGSSSLSPAHESSTPRRTTLPYTSEMPFSKQLLTVLQRQLIAMHDTISKHRADIATWASMLRGDRTSGSPLCRASNAGGTLACTDSQEKRDMDSGRLHHSSVSGMLVLPACVASRVLTDLTPESLGAAGDEQQSSLLTVCGELGRGAQGVVYRGVWRGLPVAVKSLLLLQAPQTPGLAGPSDTTSHAIQEAAISASVSHPNLVATYTYMLRRMGEGEGQEGADKGGSSNLEGGPAEGGPALVEAAAQPPPHVGSGPEVWKLTLVQELCDANSLRTCLQNGTLAACRVMAAEAPRFGVWSPVCLLRPSGKAGSGTTPVEPQPAATNPTTVEGTISTGQSSPLPQRHCHSLDSAKPTTTTQPPPPLNPSRRLLPHRQPPPSPPPPVTPEQPGPVPPRSVVLMVALQVARGLAHLHVHGIVHADVSSANVLLKTATATQQAPSSGTGLGRSGDTSGSGTASTPGGEHMPYSYGYVAKLCDFGLSGRLISLEATHVSGVLRRSSAYSPPELVCHGRAGPAGDVYTLAVVLWELVQGLPLPALLARPEGCSVQTWLSQQSLGDPLGVGALPSELLSWPPGTPSALVELVGECLREEPGDRPSAQQVCSRLQGMLREEGVWGWGTGAVTSNSERKGKREVLDLEWTPCELNFTKPRK